MWLMSGKILDVEARNAGWGDALPPPRRCTRARTSDIRFDIIPSEWKARAGAGGDATTAGLGGEDGRGAGVTAGWIRR